MNNLVGKIFDEQRLKHKSTIKVERINKADMLNDIKLKQKKIEEALIRTSHPKLCSKMEKEWTDLEIEKERLNNSNDSKVDEQKLKQNLVIKTMKLFTNPLEIRKK